MRFNCSSKG